MDQHNNELLCVGHILGAQGLKGWVRVFSNTSPRENIVSYGPWYLDGGEELRKTGIEGKVQGKNIIAKLDGVEDRTQAEAMAGRKIYIPSSQLPRLDDDDYYWSDLIGLEVKSLQDEALGVVESMLETGASDVMVLSGDRERLIPFVIGDVVREVDLENRCIIVDWLPEY
ncbi:MAG: 16S rRNA processing protein RimM [Planctomycetota bacterium]|jgi:16S rRNA processing protein RimM